MALERIESVAPVSGAREGVGTDEESETEDAINDDEDGRGKATIQEAVTHSGRVISKPAHYIEEIGAVTSDYEIGLTVSEIRYYVSMKAFPEGKFAPGEIACIGAGLVGGGFSNTSELDLMKYKKASSNHQQCPGIE
jgi:adenosylmethionine-8-amino-7-oxononanoate aminotransferase